VQDIRGTYTYIKTGMRSVSEGALKRGANALARRKHPFSIHRIPQDSSRTVEELKASLNKSPKLEEYRVERIQYTHNVLL
jgi:hypothetical protein